jgi:hypothetical protein
MLLVADALFQRYGLSQGLGSGRTTTYATIFCYQHALLYIKCSFLDQFPFVKTLPAKAFALVFFAEFPRFED